MSKLNTTNLSSPSGIGGWLTLLVIGIFLSPLMTLGNLLALYNDVYYENWVAISQAYPDFAIFLVSSALMGIIGIIIMSYVIRLLLRMIVTRPSGI